MRHRVLLISLYHPAIVRGGAQQLCYELFNALKKTEFEPILLASVEHSSDPALFKSGAYITGFDGRRNEFVFLCQGYDHVWHKNKQPVSLEKFESFLSSTAPTVIHFHHFVTFGLEYLAAARRHLDRVGGRLILTFHEFLAICLAYGQMVRATNGSLCDRASSVRCHQCYPGYTPEFFSMRRMWIQRHLDFVDVFVAPSEFLRRRYIEWGIPEHKIICILNGHRYQSVPSWNTSENAAVTRNRNRFAFLGQLFDTKGLGVLFDAICLLRRRGISDFNVDVYGSNLNIASDKFRDQFESFFNNEQDEGGEERVRFHGSYDHSNLGRIMEGVDWILVPSTWWENNPLVVGEAFLYGKPVICSNIGGMAERVHDDKDGLHFIVGDGSSLANVMTRAMSETGLWERLRKNIAPPPTIDTMAHEHIVRCYEPPPAGVSSRTKSLIGSRNLTSLHSVS